MPRGFVCILSPMDKMEAKAAEHSFDHELKKEFRRLTKLWHPDTWEIGLPEKSESVFKVLGSLFKGLKEEGLSDFSRWPRGFEEGEQIELPAFSAEELNRLNSGNIGRKKIFLPATPREFLNLLAYISVHGRFPDKEFPRVRLHISGGRDPFQEGSEDHASSMDRQFHDEFQRFKDALGKAESLEKLNGMIGAFDVLPPGTAKENGLYEVADGQAEYLLSGKILGAKSKNDLLSIWQKIIEFSFYDDKARERLVKVFFDRAREYFRGKITRAASLSGITKSRKEITDFYEELGAGESDSEELVDLAEKKTHSYSHIWGARERNKSIDK